MRTKGVVPWHGAFFVVRLFHGFAVFAME